MPFFFAGICTFSGSTCMIERVTGTICQVWGKYLDEAKHSNYLKTE
jgi:hypothetical protein